MSEVEHNDILELLPAYALSSLDTDEAAIVSQHLPGCEACQAELVAYKAVVDLMPLAAPDAQPSPALKERLVAQIESAPSTERVTLPTPSESKRSWGQQLGDALQNLFTGPLWRPVGLLIVIALAISNLVLWQQLNAPDPNAWQRVRLTGTEIAPEARGIIYISADGQNGTFIVDQMPQLDPEQQYQLWLIHDGQRTSGSVFSVDDDGYRGLQIDSPLPLQEYDSFGITIEPAGGSPQPTGERVLGYNL